VWGVLHAQAQTPATLDSAVHQTPLLIYQTTACASLSSGSIEQVDWHWLLRRVSDAAERRSHGCAATTLQGLVKAVKQPISINISPLESMYQPYCVPC
jgi:hypothetical protein